MKFSRIVAICLLFLAAGFLTAREAFAADSMTAGVEIGTDINKVHLSGSDAEGVSTGFKAGLLVGGFVTVPVSGMFEFQPEVAYAQKHSSVDGGADFKFNESDDFIEIPLLAKLNFNHKGSTGFYVVAGPGLNFLTRAKQTDSVSNGVSQPDENNKSAFNTFDASIIAGAGVTMGKFGVEARYDGGLRNLNKSLNSPDDPANLTIKERTITILARWSFK